MNVDGKNVVVTGKIDGESRLTAEQKLREAGAFVQSSVTGSTDLLVTGAKVGATKTNKAAALGVTVIPWQTLWNGGGGNPATNGGTIRPLPASGPNPNPPTPAHARGLTSRQVSPMLCKPATELPAGEGWSYEVKWDGLRCVATVRDGHVLGMASRTAKSDYADEFPEIAAALCELPDCVIDGELVGIDNNGGHSTATVRTGTQFVVYDILECLGQDLRGQQLEVRRTMLREIIDPDGAQAPLHLSPVYEDGDELLASVKRTGLEGVVAKRLRSVYTEGARNECWLKIKVRNEQEFVVLGWIEGEGANAGAPGSLVLGVYDDGGPVYCGRVGTGKTRDFWMHFATLPQAPPLRGVPMAPCQLRKVQWVEPSTVVQVAFQRWTEDGCLVHPSLQGIRTDKAAADVRREAC